MPGVVFGVRFLRVDDVKGVRLGQAVDGEAADMIVVCHHRPIQKADTDAACADTIAPILSQLEDVNAQITRLNNERKDKKEDEIPVADKEALRNAENEAADLRKKQEGVYSEYAQNNNLVKQLIDLALLSNNMLRGEALSRFVKRSFDML